MKNTYKVLFLSMLLAVSVSLAAENTDKKVNTDATSSSTCSISGQVLDQTTGEALAGVAVKVAGTDKVTYTDFDGKFAFVGLGQGEYTLESSLISYEKGLLNSFEINAGEVKSVEISLNKSK
ncbi:MAG TPA: carboxypeptidase-like regulatory domain-containing protein [Williamwhitmania sp.]|nr:carboxypeptidase-like regulatory domain-containing protein [Williamwhitmania sp.]